RESKPTHSQITTKIEGRMRTTIIIAFALALPPLAAAATVPSLDLRELTDDADTIIVGPVLTVDESRETTAVRAVPGVRGSGTDALSRVLTLLVDGPRTSTRR